ncbi:hypothetical protein [Nocardia sp. R6R-6]|uniref:hypothetical protein n=1 Tax=Nocardia sp. R6R-6 TaxID=3459303 RepID=UPI00403E355E
MSPNPFDDSALNYDGLPLYLPAIPGLALDGAEGIDNQAKEHNSSSLTDRALRFPLEQAAFNAISTFFGYEEEPMALRMLETFWRNLPSEATDPRRGGTPIPLQADEMEKVTSTAWARQAIFNGQSYVGGPGGNRSPGDPADPHLAGIQDKIDDAVAYVNAHPEMAGHPIGFRTAWLPTPSDVDNTDPPGSGMGDVHNAFGHYYLGSTGTITVDGRNPDGTNHYHVWFQNQSWKYYSFKDVPDSGEVFNQHAWFARMNNLMRMANIDGLADNFQVAGITGIREQDGTTTPDGHSLRATDSTDVPWHDATTTPPIPHPALPTKPAPNPTHPPLATPPPHTPAPAPAPPTTMPPPGPAPTPPKRDRSRDVASPFPAPAQFSTPTGLLHDLVQAHRHNADALSQLTAPLTPVPALPPGIWPRRTPTDQSLTITITRPQPATQDMPEAEKLTCRTYLPFR